MKKTGVHAEAIGHRFNPVNGTFTRIVLFALMASVIFSGRTSRAETIIVDSLADNGFGSLREAIGAAASGDTIQIIAEGTLFLSSGALLLDKNLEIAGPGKSKLAIDSQKTSPIFIITNAVDAKISDLTVTNGYNGINSPEGQGGGIRNLGNLTLLRCAVARSTSEFGGGGGIYSQGNLTVRQCTVSSNNSFYGGGISSGSVLIIESSTIHGNVVNFGEGGGIAAGGIVGLTNSTISGNLTIFGNGGGIYAAGTMDIYHCTIASNRAVSFSSSSFGRGGGLFVVNSAVVRGKNTLLAGNFAETAGPDCFGAMISQGHNLMQNVSGWSGSAQGTDVVGISAQLGPLQENGGSIFTHALSASSPAVDAASVLDFFVTDQREISRPMDANDDCVFAPDIGAYELEDSSLPQAESILLTQGKQIQFSGLPGRTYRIEATLSFAPTQWVTLTTNLVPPSGLFEFTDTQAGFASRFYRAAKICP